MNPEVAFELKPCEHRPAGRWRSGSDEYEKIPCRCEHCKAQGVLRIAH